MQDVISLDKLNIGDRVKINEIQSLEIPAKYYELGFYPGSLVEVKHKAPLNGPICVNIIENNALIAIRKSEAKLIVAEKI